MSDQYPLGKLRPDDQGVLEIAIQSFSEGVFVRFGKVIDWVGFDRELAVRIIVSLREAAANVTTGPGGMSHPVAIRNEQGRVVLEFPKPTDFLGLSKVAALALADSIEEQIKPL